MKVVIADTSPANYLVLIDTIEVLPRLYRRIVIPDEVLAELSAPGAPPSVAAWAAARPDWLARRSACAKNGGPSARRSGFREASGDHPG